MYLQEHVIGGHVADTCKPDDILQEEELERVNGLLQRDRLVRGLGIVEHVQNILSNSPGNTCTYRHDRKVQSVSAVSMAGRLSVSLPVLPVFHFHLSIGRF